MTTNRYVSILKLISNKRDKLKRTDLEKYCMLGIIKPNLKYLKETNKSRQDLKNEIQHQWNKNTSLRTKDKSFSQYIEGIIKASKNKSSETSERMKHKLEKRIDQILDRAHKLYDP